jgi:plastocyanin
MKKHSLLFAGTVMCAALFLTAGLTRPAYANPDLLVVRADTRQPITNEAVALAAGEGPEGIVVSQKDKTFAPGSIEVRVGQPIDIHNDDAAVHNAYCSSGDFKYNSGPQQPGTRSRLAFTKAGTYEVRCAIHPKMKLAVTVLE